MELNLVTYVNVAYLSSGIGCGWVAPILHRYKNSNSEFSLSAEACSWIACTHFAGRGIGCFLIAILVDKVGRNMAFKINPLLSLTMWIGVFLSKSIPVHCVMRFIFGMTIGFTEMVAPLYIGENSQPNFRGIFSGMCTIAFYIGEVLEFVIATYFSYSTIALINIGLICLIIFSTLLLQEPAQHFLAKGNEIKAEKRFYKMRGTNEATKSEFEETKQQMAEKKENFSFKLLADKSIRVVVIINCLLYISGYAAINSMSSLILMPIMNLTPNELTIILGIIQLFSVFISSIIIERIGRRPLLMISAFISFISHLFVAVLFIFIEYGTPIPNTPWLLFILTSIYSIIVAGLLFPICTTIRGELLSPQLKPAGGCLAIIMNSFVSVGMTGIFLSIAEAFGMKINYIFFAFTSVVLLVYVYIDMPETRGLTLPEIQKSFKK